MTPANQKPAAKTDRHYRRWYQRRVRPRNRHNSKSMLLKARNKHPEQRRKKSDDSEWHHKICSHKNQAWRGLGIMWCEKHPVCIAQHQTSKRDEHQQPIWTLKSHVRVMCLTPKSCLPHRSSERATMGVTPPGLQFLILHSAFCIHLVGPSAVLGIVVIFSKLRSRETSTRNRD